MKTDRLRVVVLVAHAAVAVLGAAAAAAPGPGKFAHPRDALVAADGPALKTKRQADAAEDLKETVVERFMRGKQAELDKMRKEASELFSGLVRELNKADFDAAAKFDQLSTICAPSPGPKYDKPPNESDVQDCLRQTDTEVAKLRDTVVQLSERCTGEHRRQAASGITEQMEAFAKEHQRKVEEMKKSGDVMVKCDTDDCVRVEMSSVRTSLLQFERARDAFLRSALESAKEGLVALSACTGSFYEKFLAVSDYHEKTYQYCELYPVGKIKPDKTARS